MITRYADVRAALADPRLAKDVHRWPDGGKRRPSEEAGGVHAHMLQCDPPEHTRVRRLVQKAFTPRRAAQLRPRVTEIAAGLLDADVAVGDVVIPAGQWVFGAITAANRDPAQFPDPDRLDLCRDASGHVAFGHGIHYCLGAPLARMEAEVALGALLDRFPGLALAAAPSELRWRPVSLMNGLESLPVRLARPGREGLSRT